MPKPKAYTDKQIIAALEKNGGFVTYAAAAMGCHYTTITKRVEKSAVIKEALESITEKKLDFVESALMKRIKAGDLGAICFFLKCKGKKRDYVERQEITGADGKDLTIEVVSFKTIKKKGRNERHKDL